MKDLIVPEKKFRPEIEGVRVLAAFLVAVYHIWFGKVSGGVDVFFIVSGYLITTSLLSRVAKLGTINLTEYYLGLVRRLWPLALTVVLFTITASYLIFPASRWITIVQEALSSIFYYENWQLAFNSVDYLAQNVDASPFQHFWALSLQGQFYITWPFIIFLAYFLATRIFKTPLRKTLLTILVVMFIASLSYSVYITEVNQPWAYFNTFARVWEFSLGGILALLLPYLKLPKVVSFIVGWTGFCIISLTGMVLPVSDVFPGYAALLPITGVIFVIVSAENASGFGVQKLLGTKLFLFLGSVSYAFYLWHWPLFIFYLAYFDVENVTVLAGILIIIVAFILSLVTSRLIEKPIQKLSPRNAKKKIIAIAASFLIPVAGVAIAWNMYGQQLLNDPINGTDMSQVAKQEYYTGLEELPEEYYSNNEEEELVPDFISVTKDLPEFYQQTECYTTMIGEGVKTCSYGDTTDPEYTLALVGGSHSGHWFPPIVTAAEQLNIEVQLYYKDACRFSTDDFNGGLDETCMSWNEELVEVLEKDMPDMIFTTATVEGSLEIPQGYIDLWENYEGRAEIIAIRDTPKFPYEVPACVEDKGMNDCHTEREGMMEDGKLTEEGRDLPENVHLIDFSDYICDDDTCYSVLNNIIIYRDTNHITTTFSETLAAPMRRELTEVIESLS
ncbi:Peptidoglycan/LPS O-acetylase OafA/YrhL, contains acyltransferase and SGNH-hydrolase domains [Gracilibacillus ureilyticus]|uniref:Peptidoglycan/LPS O-acetylase OafA/YrhL, contains acyltransferase and SGNH-hydrolase domains n=1 Tax=Gracilibacillus ureilyticus TaxID=531814 RepID=A0A1H9RF87_9BACI|nr:acyltransferase family protein [Gracilibacillus ureilyticus]SER70629.1 Peptidoglycan/LPS O-acetylase OafA/YrhL, contains acyltransferase and SGNH-hydrolase domains [Gracilibacillus ureilyticus]